MLTAEQEQLLRAAWEKRVYSGSGGGDYLTPNKPYVTREMLSDYPLGQKELYLALRELVHAFYLRMQWNKSAQTCYVFSDKAQMFLDPPTYEEPTLRGWYA